MVQLTLLNLSITGMKSFTDKCVIMKHSELYNCHAHK